MAPPPAPDLLVEQEAEPSLPNLRPPEQATLVDGDGCRFGDYQLLREIARGGMGIVYHARQLSLNRLVAVKMILPGCLADEESVRRFRTEAQAAAQLQHPNIVAVHEVGVFQGKYFYSMAFIDGQSLAQKVQRYPLSPRQAATYVKTIAEATHYAHEHHVLHRDLKPSNILIDAEDRPHIADFGLAKLTHERSDLTLSGVVMGSPSYLAPELAQGRASAASTRSDLYALGAILYELVTGRPPFKGESATATLKLVVETDPVPPRQLNPKVSRDLETICLKCLEKDPGRRYDGAQALADDLGRYLKGEPIRARPVGVMGKTVQWCRRRPALAAALTVSVLLLFLGLAGITWQWRRAESGWQRAEDERKSQRLRAYAADMRAADIAVAAGNLGQASDLLDRYLPQGGEADFRGVEWRYLWERSHSTDVGGFEYASIPLSCDLSPDDRWWIVSGMDGWIRVHNAQGQEVVQQRSGFSKVDLPRTRVAFASQGGLAAAATKTQILVWDTKQWQLQQHLECGNAQIAFSSDGRWLAGLNASGLQVWSTRTWQLELASRASPLQIKQGYGMAFTPDSSRIAVTDSLGQGIVFFSLEERMPTLAAYPIRAGLRVVISPNGHWMAASSVQDQVRVWDLVTGVLAAELCPPEDHWILGLAFSPDSQMLATGGSNHKIRLWQAGTTNVLRTLHGHSGEIWWLRFSEDGQWLYSGSVDKTVRRWATTAPITGPRSLPLPPESVLLDMGPGGSPARLLNLSAPAIEDWDLEHTNRLRRVALQVDPKALGGEFITMLEDYGLEVGRLYGDHLLLLPYFRRRCEVYDVRSGHRIFPPSSNTNRFIPACISADGRWLAGIEETSERLEKGIWDLKTGQRRLTLPDLARDSGFNGNAAFAPDGNRLAYEDLHGGIQVLTPASGHTLRLSGHGRRVLMLRFSSDGRWLASGGMDATARVWDVASGQPVTPWLRTRAEAVDFSPDGRTLITTDGVHGKFRFWHVLTGAEMLEERSKSPYLARAINSAGNVLMMADPSAANRIQAARIPSLDEIDSYRSTNRLRRLEP